MSSGGKERRHPTAAFVLIMGGTTLAATLLHGIEAAIWAAAYRFLGALPDQRTAMLYSLSAITSYGHANLFLEAHWAAHGIAGGAERMAALPADHRLLFGMIEKVRSLGGQGIGNRRGNTRSYGSGLPQPWPCR